MVRAYPWTLALIAAGLLGCGEDSAFINVELGGLDGVASVELSSFIELDGNRQSLLGVKIDSARARSFRLQLPPQTLGTFNLSVTGLDKEDCRNKQASASITLSGAPPSSVPLTLDDDPGGCEVRLRLVGDPMTGALISSDSFCQEQCTIRLIPGNSSRLTAVLTPGAIFGGFSAPCGAEPSCTLSGQSDGPREIEAAFYERQHCTPERSRERFCWEHPLPRSFGQLRRIVGFARDDIFALSDDSTLLHYNGTSWGPYDLGFPAGLRDLGGLSRNGYWALDKTNRLFFTESGVRAEASLPAGVEATSVVSSDGFTVWVGGNAVLTGVKAEGLRRIEGGAVRGVRKLIATALANDVWANTDSGVFHFDGARWYQITQAPANDISGDRPNQVWIAEPDGVRLWDGRRLSTPAGSLPGVSALHTVLGETWAFGQQGVFLRWQRTSAAWEPFVGPQVPVTGAWGSAPNDVWTITSNGIGPHWDGFTWSGTSQRTPDSKLVAVGGLGHLWTFGPDWDVLRSEGDSIISVPLAPAPDSSDATSAPRSAWVNDDGEAFVLTQRAILTITATGRIKSEPLPAATGFSTLFGLRRERTAGDVIYDMYLVGARGQIWEHSDKVRAGLPFSWQDRSVGGADSLSAVWGSGPTDVWAVGSRGLVLRRQAGKWTRPAGVSVATQTSLIDVSGSGPDDVWLLGNSGGKPVLLRWTGAPPLQVVETGISEAARRVVVTGPGEVWLLTAGDSGKDLYFGDGTGSFRRIQTDATVPIQNLAQSTTGDLFAVGHRGMLLRHAR